MHKRALPNRVLPSPRFRGGKSCSETARSTLYPPDLTIARLKSTAATVSSSVFIPEQSPPFRSRLSPRGRTDRGRRAERDMDAPFDRMLPVGLRESEVPPGGGARCTHGLLDLRLIEHRRDGDAGGG